MTIHSLSAGSVSQEARSRHVDAGCIDDELADLGDDGVTVIGGPGGVAAREDNALQVHGPSSASLTPNGTTVRDQCQASNGQVDHVVDMSR